MKQFAFATPTLISDFIFSGLIYNENYNDLLYVIQNGSLLRIDRNFESFDVYDHYCLEHDDEEGVMTAVVCEFDDMLVTVGRVQALIFATCMLISVPVRSACSSLISQIILSTPLFLSVY